MEKNEARAPPPPGCLVSSLEEETSTQTRRQPGEDTAGGQLDVYQPRTEPSEKTKPADTSLGDALQDWEDNEVCYLSPWLRCSAVTIMSGGASLTSTANGMNSLASTF